MADRKLSQATVCMFVCVYARVFQKLPIIGTTNHTLTSWAQSIYQKGHLHFNDKA